MLLEGKELSKPTVTELLAAEQAKSKAAGDGKEEQQEAPAS
jgi:hypothetical protein